MSSIPRFNIDDLINKLNNSIPFTKEQKEFFISKYPNFASPAVDFVFDGKPPRKSRQYKPQKVEVQDQDTVTLTFRPMIAVYYFKESQDESLNVTYMDIQDSLLRLKTDEIISFDTTRAATKYGLSSGSWQVVDFRDRPAPVFFTPHGFDGSFVYAADTYFTTVRDGDYLILFAKITVVLSRKLFDELIADMKARNIPMKGLPLGMGRESWLFERLFLKDVPTAFYLDEDYSTRTWKLTDNIYIKLEYPTEQSNVERFWDRERDFYEASGLEDALRQSE